MFYWTGTISSHLLGGMSEFALRLPNALAAIGLCLLTCSAASRRFGPRAGLWAGFTLMTFLQFFVQAVGYRPDVPLTVFVGAGSLVYAHGCEGAPRILAVDVGADRPVDAGVGFRRAGGERAQSVVNRSVDMYESRSGLLVEFEDAVHAAHVDNRVPVIERQIPVAAGTDGHATLPAIGQRLSALS